MIQAKKHDTLGQRAKKLAIRVLIGGSVGMGSCVYLEHKQAQQQPAQQDEQNTVLKILMLVAMGGTGIYMAARGKFDLETELPEEIKKRRFLDRLEEERRQDENRAQQRDN